MSIVNFTGGGKAGTWVDAKNWQGGVVPGASDTALLFNAGSQMFTGPIPAGTIMLLGTGTVSFDGTVSATDTGFCSGIMVCQNETMTMNAGSTLNDFNGALLIGVHGEGSFVANGTAQKATTINTANATIGKFANAGVGHVTIDDAIWNNATVAFVGFDGSGTLDIRDHGKANIGGNLSIAGGAQSAGAVTIEAGSTINVGGGAGVGTPLADGTAGGTGTITVAAGGTLNVGYWMVEGSTSSIVLNGGAIHMGTSGQGWLAVQSGATVSGYGTITSTSNIFSDAGTVTARDGTLVVGSNIGGAGTLAVAANSALKLDGAADQTAGIAFTGANATLEFQNNLWVTSPITGFSAGDKIIFDAMIDSVKWTASTGSLALVSGGHTVDTLHLGGMAPSALFDVQHAGATSIILLHG